MTSFDLLHLEADLNVFPTKLYTYQNPDEFTCFVFPDLHGNTVKLLWYLLFAGIILLDEQDYYKFKQAYDAYDPADRQTAPAITITIENIINNIEILHANTGFLLLGDDVAERGKNDHFTILLYVKIHKLNIHYHVLYSNHNHWFIQAMESLLKHKGDFSKVSININPLVYTKQQGQSLVNMFTSIHLGITSYGELLEFYNIYRTHLKLISVEQLTDGRPLIYTHAVIEDITLNKMADVFHLPKPFVNHRCNFDDLLRLTKAYNRHFSDLASQGKITETFRAEDALFQKYINPSIGPSIFDISHPLTRLSWSRATLLTIELQPGDKINSGQLKEYRVKCNPRAALYIHGHNGGEHIDNAHLDLDSCFGRPGHDKSKLKVCITTRKLRTLSPKPRLLTPQTNVEPAAIAMIPLVPAIIPRAASPISFCDQSECPASPNVIEKLSETMQSGVKEILNIGFGIFKMIKTKVIPDDEDTPNPSFESRRPH